MLLLTVTLAAVSIAQAPEKMSFQAVIRDAGDQLVTNQEVGLRVSILQSSIDGTVVYQEIYNPNPETNNNGLLTIEIGGGVPLTGTFSDIDWSAGPYFIKTETDPSGGTTYTITGTSQLLSVPYALHSGTADILTGEITESQISDLQNYLTEETDPLFTGHSASGIEADDIGNWDEAHGWGDHADEGYLTEETDPLFEASPSAGILAADIDNWDEAYSWGDHTQGGYLTQEYQVLSISNDTIFLTGGSFVKLPDPYPDDLFQGTSIITREEQIMLNNWVGNPFQKWEMCYSKTTDGASSEAFHNLCDTRGPSITLIKLDNGFVFGGYNDYHWTSVNAYGEGNGFIFSITSQKRYPVVRRDRAVYNHQSYGPTFGSGHDFMVSSVMNLSYCNFPHGYSRDGVTASSSDEACQELAGINRSTNSEISELEVWILK